MAEAGVGTMVYYSVPVHRLPVYADHHAELPVAEKAARAVLSPPPSADNPVVLHLFGTDQDPASMVLTEDNHLDYLARISHDQEIFLPASVNALLAKNTLLFLGYRLEDLDLKVILRADEGLTYQWISPVLISCVQANITSVNFSTRDK